MNQQAWRDELRKYFESVRIIEKAKAETLESFDQFCEFIAEPAFDSLAGEMKEYGIKVRIRKEKGRAIHCDLSFPGSRIDNFHYRIVLPRNSIQLKLGLVLKGRRYKSAPLEEKTDDFMKGLAPAALIKLAKEDLIRDIIERYKDFNLAALTSAD
jgi:hypothetical protein